MTARAIFGLIIGGLIGAALAGCLRAPDSPEPAGFESRSRPVVVAVLDTGTNPYHVAFAANARVEAGGLAERFAARPFRLAAFGEYSERVVADASAWDSIGVGELVVFPGTRLMAVSFLSEGRRILDDSPVGLGHGTSTTSVIARNAPGVLIVLVQADLNFCSTPECIADASVPAAMAWIADQPWIDVVSTSFGIPANAPDVPELHPEMLAFLNASRSAHARGKIIVSAAGNEPTPAITGYMNSPPWLISVGGITYAQKGEAVLSGRLADVAANFSEEVALSSSIDASGWNAGTSFAAPNVAAALATSLDLVRLSSAHEIPAGGLALVEVSGGTLATIRNEDVRAALNASSLLIDPATWNPTANRGNQTDPIVNVIYQGASATTPVVLPGAQGGWGYVDARLADLIAARLVSLDFVTPGEKSDVAAFQSAAIELRRAYWAQYH